MTFELVPHTTSCVLHKEAGVEGEHGHHLLLHVDPGLLLMDIADLVQSVLDVYILVLWLQMEVGRCGNTDDQRVKMVDPDQQV